MLDFDQHKEYLWKYTLTYGKLKNSHIDKTKKVFPFFDILMNKTDTIDKYRNDEIKNKLKACSTVEEIYDSISFEYKDFYFMEVSSLLHDNIEIYSKLLRKTFDIRGIGDFITRKNYQQLSTFADTETQTYILSKI